MNIFSDWFKDIRVWKLNTAGDILAFVLLLLAGVLVFWLVIRRVNYARRPDVAVERVAKKLTKLGGRHSRVYTDFVLRTPAGEQPFDMLWVAQDRLHTVRVLPHGTRVSGTKTGAKWRLGGSVNETIENPLPALKAQRQSLLSFLADAGFSDVEVEPLVVCADTYELPRIRIDGFLSIVAFQRLNAWRKKHPLIRRWFYDVDGLCAHLERAMVSAEKL